MAGPAARTWPACGLTGLQRGGFESHLLKRGITIFVIHVIAVMRNERLDVKRWVSRVCEPISIGIRCSR